MTLREKFAAYLEHTGCVVIQKHKRAYWTYAAPQGGYYYLGASGSLRYGRNRTTCQPVSNAFKAKALVFTDTAGLDILALLQE